MGPGVEEGEATEAFRTPRDEAERQMRPVVMGEQGDVRGEGDESGASLPSYQFFGPASRYPSRRGPW